MNKAYTIFIVVLFLFSCKKSNNSNNNDSNNKTDASKLTEQVLTTDGSAQRVWTLVEMHIKYLSATGATDSTFDIGPIYNLNANPQQIRFSIAPDELTGNSAERTFYLYTDPNVLDRVFQGIGMWALSSDGKTLTCST